MAKTASAESQTAVVLTCAGCGRPIQLIATDTGAEIRDVPEFLRVHANCLKRAVAEERRIELPD